MAWMTIAQAAKLLSAIEKKDVQMQLIHQAVSKGKLAHEKNERGVKVVEEEALLKWYNNRGTRGSGRTATPWFEQNQASYQRRLEAALVKLGAKRSIKWDQFNGSDELHYGMDIKRAWRVGIEFVNVIVDEVEDKVKRMQQLSEELALREKIVAHLVKNRVPAKLADREDNGNEIAWLVKRDSMSGGIVISPPMCGLNGLKNLAFVLRMMRQLGLEVDDNVSTFHVWVDIIDYEIDDLKALYILYWLFEKPIDDIMPLSRRGNNNRYLRSVRVPYFGQIAKAYSFERVLSVLRLEFNKAILDARFKLNGELAMKEGVIEFKHMVGTLNSAQAAMWVRTCLAFTREAKMQKDFRNKRISFDEMVETLHLDEDMELFYIGEKQARAIEIRRKDEEARVAEYDLKSRLDEWVEIWQEDKDECINTLTKAYRKIGYSEHMAAVKVDVMVVRINMALRDMGVVEEVEETEEGVADWDETED